MLAISKIKMNITFRPYTSDGYIIDEVFSQDIYRTKEFKLENKFVVDIGAHIGTFTTLALRQGANVYSYEPDEENFALLRANTNLYSGVIIRNEAVVFDGKTKGLRLSNPQYNRGNCTIGKVGRPVDAVKFYEDVVKGFDKIDYLKIDIEGAERGLLSHPEWLETVEAVGIETHDKLFHHFLEMFEKLGYKFLSKNIINEELGTIVCKK